MHDDGHSVFFDKEICVITVATNHIPLVARKEGNVYVLDFELQETTCCLAAIDNDPCCPVALTIVEGGVEYNCADKSN